ncbi:conserved protein of unknown function [Ralstonia solanacearum CFBP2957]|nr:conserved protein of unknown function [Ralstonia solanacearum CFBP2957]
MKNVIQSLALVLVPTAQRAYPPA